MDKKTEKTVGIISAIISILQFIFGVVKDSKNKK
jgi:hypothetical protein